VPFSQTQKQAAFAPCFAAAPKPLVNYVTAMAIDPIYNLFVAIGAPALTQLATAFYPDKLKSLVKDLTHQELGRLGAMNIATLQSLNQMVPSWVKSMLRVIGGPAPVTFHNSAPGGLPAVVGLVLNANGALDQTSTKAALPSTVITEINGGGAATRNLIFNVSGNCVAEVNFGNHGGTAVSGHAHVYPITCVPITGHHGMGTPHVDMADYPAVWRTLTGGVLPATPLGT
jgi:hypothetical protein